MDECTTQPARSTVRKITQAEFDLLYIETLDSESYRPIIDGKPSFRLPQLLAERGYALDLTDISLRNRNLRYADFRGICLDGADLSGSICNHSDFTDVSCLNIKADSRTKFHEAKLTYAQLMRLQATPDSQAEQAVIKQEVADYFGEDLAGSFA